MLFILVLFWILNGIDFGFDHGYYGLVSGERKFCKGMLIHYLGEEFVMLPFIIKIKKNSTQFLFLLITLTLSACGGGGGATNTPVTPTCVAPQVLNAATNTCVNPSIPTHLIGGNVAGLANGASLTLILNTSSLNKTLVINSAGSFSFGSTSALAEGTAFTVAVQTQPSGQSCVVTNASGQMSTSDVANVQVNCATNANGNDIGNGITRINDDVVNGIKVDTYKWLDSQGKERTISLKKQDASNAGNGGYAIYMTYYNAQNKQIIVNANDASADGGFGYFVGHELYRSFSDGSNGTIAALHGEDDSPLGRGFPVVASNKSTISSASTSASHQFTINYPRWGTVAAMSDVNAATPVSLNAHQKFTTPVTIQWLFESGKDFPRIDVKVDMSAISAGQTAFDVRGPYGSVSFANADTGAVVTNVQWGDSAKQFSSLNDQSTCLKQSTLWDWSMPVSSRPYHVMTANSAGTAYEIGLFEFKQGSDTGLVYGGYSDNRGITGAGFSDYAGNAANGALQSYEWPFQSANYSIAPNNNCSTGQKFAWGSAAFYGSQISTVYLNHDTSVSLTPVPANKQLIYRVCLVLAESSLKVSGDASITRTNANNATPSCASGSLLN